MNTLVQLLHEGHHSCVIRDANGQIHCYDRRGVLDLYETYTRKPSILKGAQLADKVIGKGAAALMVLGGVSEIHADVISTPALNLLKATHIPTTAMEEVPFIKNCARDGRCPLETTCDGLHTPEEIFPAIVKFVNQLKNNNYEHNR